MANDDVQRYLNGIESQHITKPKFMAHVEALLKKVDYATGLIKDMPLMFYTRNAIGAQLNVLGEIVGVDRRFPPISIPGLPSLLDDDTYRKVILARIVQNQWDGSNEKFKEMWDATVGGELNATYRDNFDMTMDMNITGQTEPTMIEMILRGFIIPKPMGVGLNVTLSDETILNDETMYVNAKFSSDAARIGVHNHLDVFTEAAPTVYSAVKSSLNAAKIGILNHLDQETETTVTPFMACCIPTNSARITIPNHIPDEQSATDTMFYGANAYANDGRIAVATK